MLSTILSGLQQAIAAAFQCYFNVAEVLLVHCYTYASEQLNLYLHLHMH